MLLPKAVPITRFRFVSKVKQSILPPTPSRGISWISSNGALSGVAFVRTRPMQRPVLRRKLQQIFSRFLRWLPRLRVAQHRPVGVHQIALIASYVCLDLVWVNVINPALE
jgi:hypothetical protein